MENKLIAEWDFAVKGLQKEINGVQRNHRIINTSINHLHDLLKHLFSLGLVTPKILEDVKKLNIVVLKDCAKENKTPV